jgi:hypothetical protein
VSFVVVVVFASVVSVTISVEIAKTLRKLQKASYRRFNLFTTSNILETVTGQLNKKLLENEILTIFQVD